MASAMAHVWPRHYLLFFFLAQNGDNNFLYFWALYLCWCKKWNSITYFNRVFLPVKLALGSLKFNKLFKTTTDYKIYLNILILRQSSSKFELTILNSENFFHILNLFKLHFDMLFDTRMTLNVFRLTKFSF